MDIMAENNISSIVYHSKITAADNRKGNSSRQENR